MKSRRLIFDVVIKPVVFIKAAQLVFFYGDQPISTVVLTVAVKTIVWVESV